MPSIAWVSDLHLDHTAAAARQVLLDQIAAASASTLVITGDISSAPRLIRDLESVADAAGCPVYFVLGNHDHYGASVADVRNAVIELAARRPQVRWLPPAGVVALDELTALVGVDGWADGRHGNPLATPLVLNDDRLIGELAAQQTRAAKLTVKRALADADASRLGVLLDRAVASLARRIVVATHMPPFVEALPVVGHLAGPDWLPILVCDATGAVLKRAAAEHLDREFLVLCGHTHVERDVRVAQNLRCMVAGARYGAPGVRVVAV